MYSKKVTNSEWYFSCQSYCVLLFTNLVGNHKIWFEQAWKCDKNISLLRWMEKKNIRKTAVNGILPSICSLCFGHNVLFHRKLQKEQMQLPIRSNFVAPFFNMTTTFYFACAKSWQNQRTNRNRKVNQCNRIKRFLIAYACSLAYRRKINEEIAIFVRFPMLCWRSKYLTTFLLPFSIVNNVKKQISQVTNMFL